MTPQKYWFSTVEVKHRQWHAMAYTLVAQSEADLASGKISVFPYWERPWEKKRDTATIQVPNGTIELEILSISRE